GHPAGHRLRGGPVLAVVLEQPDPLGPPPGRRPPTHGRPGGGTGRDHRGAPSTPRRRPSLGRGPLAANSRSARPRRRRRRRRGRRRGGAGAAPGERPAEEVLGLGGAGPARGARGTTRPPATSPPAEP